MLGLVVVHDEAGVDDAGDPSEERQQNTQEETEDAARHQDRDGREDDAKKVAQRFQIGSRKSEVIKTQPSAARTRS